MKTRFPLVAKVVSIASLNLVLLALVLLLLARLQFRLDSGSFLLAPAQNRIIAAAHGLAMELDETPQAGWGEVLERFSRANAVDVHLLDEEGRPLAGPAWQLPAELAERIPRRQRPQGRPRPEEPRPERDERGPIRSGEARTPAPPLFLTSAGDPARPGRVRRRRPGPRRPSHRRIPADGWR